MSMRMRYCCKNIHHHHHHLARCFLDQGIQQLFGFILKYYSLPGACHADPQIASVVDRVQVVPKIEIVVTLVQETAFDAGFVHPCMLQPCRVHVDVAVKRQLQLVSVHERQREGGVNFSRHVLNVLQYPRTAAVPIVRVCGVRNVHCQRHRAAPNVDHPFHKWQPARSCAVGPLNIQTKKGKHCF